MIALWWGVVPLAALAVGITAINLVSWSRGRAGVPRARVSVLIPARNEQDTIEASVRAAAAERPFEIVVYEDRSTDGTAAILTRLQTEIPALRVVSGRPLPEGWVGKPHACQALYEASRGGLLVFVDADTTLLPGGVGRLATALDELDADLLTAFPRQRTGGLVEHLVVPLLALTYTSWLPLALIHRTADPRVLAANGQVVAARRDALQRLSGFHPVRGAVVDDMALCRAAKRAGLTVAFLDGSAIASCRMYRSAREVWEGFSKNLFVGVGGRLPALVAVVALYLLAFVAPYLALALGLLGVPGALLPGAIGVGLNLLLRGALALRFRHPLVSVVLHPVGVLIAVGIAANSWSWARRGAIRWRGRVYRQGVVR